MSITAGTRRVLTACPSHPVNTRYRWRSTARTGSLLCLRPGSMPRVSFVRLWLMLSEWGLSSGVGVALHMASMQPGLPGSPSSALTSSSNRAALQPDKKNPAGAGASK